jgi:PelA/Pel-15E family pectate lyase
MVLIDYKMKIHYKEAKYLNLIVLMLLLVFSSFLYAQSDTKAIKISTRPFADGMRHWYNIKDKNNIVNPIPNQPRYNETDYTKIADNILLFQRDNGGWPKNYDMRAILTKEQITDVFNTKHILNTTFDNATTFTHINYLAQVYTLTKTESYKKAFLKGIDFVLEAQYENGGWPQYYPLEKNYSRYITFNDGAYMGIMNLLQKIIDNDSNFQFLDEDIKLKVTNAYYKGLDCILNMQIVNKGELTVWCQQHNEVNLSPAWARAFEPPSICNAESASVVLFLMKIDNPNERIKNAIQSAVKWFEHSKIYNTRIESFEIEPFESKFTTVKTDRRVVIDSTATPIWTRYYELETGKPLFCDRNSKFLYSMAEVSVERRNGYAWYTYEPQQVLNKYSEWQKKWMPSVKVFNKN